jgi:hypothetical protein
MLKIHLKRERERELCVGLPPERAGSHPEWPTHSRAASFKLYTPVKNKREKKKGGI